jgi:two-component system, OmpR family, sensor histidine kinase KdpD
LMLKVRVVLLLPEDGQIVVKAGYPPEDVLDQADIAAAKWAWEHNRPAGRGSDTLPGAKRLFLPMRTGRGAIGVVGIDSDKPGPLLTPDQRRLLDALVDQSALAIERVHLVDDLDQAKRRVEADRLRAALLTSISHDLRTPLAAIIGAAGTLKSFPSELTDQGKAELLSTIVEESERLNRFIANLLDMTKLEAGSIKPNTARHDVSEIVGSVLERASKILARHNVEVELAADLPMLDLDPVLFEQAVFNLLDNAAKFSPLDTKIRIESWQEDGAVKLEVSDEGPGIPAGEIDRIFEKFHRADKQDQVQAGTGLGLAISRGFIEAMGGSLVAGNRPDRQGAVFTITMPVPKAAGRLDTAA